MDANIIFEYKQQQNLFSLMNIYFKVCLFRLYAITAVSIPPSLTPRNAEISNYVGLGNIQGVFFIATSIEIAIKSGIFVRF